MRDHSKKGTREEIRQMDQRSRKSIKIYGASHPRDDIRGSLNRFPDIFCMDTFIDITYMKL